MFAEESSEFQLFTEIEVNDIHYSQNNFGISI